MTLAQAHLHIYALGALVTRPKACPHNYEARCWACVTKASAYAEALGEAHDLDVRDADGVGDSPACTWPGAPAPAAHGAEVLAGEVATVRRPCCTLCGRRKPGPLPGQLDLGQTAWAHPACDATFLVALALVLLARPCRWCGSPTDASDRMCLACWEGRS